MPVNDAYSPRTVASVALGSLVVGFVLVFGGGMLTMRRAAPRVVPEVSAPTASSTAAPAPTPNGADADAEAAPQTDADADLAAAPGDAAVAPAAEGRTANVQPGVVSRCWDQNNPAVIAGANCDRLAGLDAHLQSKAAELAGCARGHGRLSLIVDLRFSTGFVRSWGGPSSTVANPGDVMVCVRRVTQPLPLATMTHAHDRYLVVVPLEW